MVVEVLGDYPEVKGVFAGGCVERGEGSSFRARAHAHVSKHDENQGWICVRSYKRIFMADGRPSQLMLHELAHILSGQGHTDKWRAECKKLGYRLPLRYQKHVKKPAPTGKSIVKRGRMTIVYNTTRKGQTRKYILHG